MLSAARHYSATAADADDVYQRAAEKLLTKRPTDRPDDELLAWLLTVARNEALMIRRTRSRESVVPFDELAAEWEAGDPAPHDRVVELESYRRGREVLKRISPDQARCLLLRADGLSYEEISDETGFNYAKVHRSLAEGRRQSRGLAERIEAGAECRRLEPMLSKFVDDELRPNDRADLDLHLANCVACQATLREYSRAPGEIASFFPVGVATGGGFAAQLAGYWSEITAWINERLANQLPATPAAEMAFGKKIALAAALAGTIVAGGAGVERFAIHDSVGDAARGAATVSQAVDAVPPPATAPDRGSETPEARDDAPSRDVEVAADPKPATDADLITAEPTVDPDSAKPRRQPGEVTKPRPETQPDPLAEETSAESGESLPENDPEWP